MALLEERVDKLERMIMELVYIQHKTEMELQDLKKTMKEFKEDIDRFKETVEKEMKEFKEEIREDTRKLKEEMIAFKDEMPQRL